MYPPDVMEDLQPAQQGPDPFHIEEEPKERIKQPIKEEEEEEDVSKCPLTGHPLKSEYDEDKDQHEENGGAEPPSSSSSYQHMPTM